MFTFLIYFRGIDPQFLLDLTPDHISALFDTISKYEEEYGIIGKQIDEYKISKRKSSVTVTPDNVDKLKDTLSSISQVSESLHKKRKL